jgi:hypothetical protein
MRTSVRHVLFSTSLHPDTKNYLQRLSVAGGSISSKNVKALDTAIKNIYSQRLRGGATDVLKYFLCLNLTDSFTGCLVPVYDDGADNATNNNFVASDWSPTLGLTSDGSTKYLNSNYIFSTSLGDFTLGGRTDFHVLTHVSNYVTPPASVERGIMGIRFTPSIKLGLAAFGLNFYRLLTTKDIPSSITSTTAELGNGVLIGNVPSQTENRIIFNGTVDRSVTSTPTAITNPIVSNYLFCLNNAGAPTAFTASSCSLFTMGFGLSTTQEITLTEIMNTFVAQVRS